MSTQHVTIFSTLQYNSAQFEIYGVTRSYSSCLLLCALEHFECGYVKWGGWREGVRDEEDMKMRWRREAGKGGGGRNEKRKGEGREGDG